MSALVRPIPSPSPSITYRSIRQEDNPALARIIRTVMTSIGCCGEGFSIHDPEVDRMFETYQSEDSAFFVAEVDGQLVGGAGIAPLKGTENVCELQKMYLLDAGRGLGVGSALMQQCLHFAKHAGYRQCYLETLARLSDACRLYEKSGFRIIPQAMGNTGHSSCNYFMLLDL